VLEPGILPETLPVGLGRDALQDELEDLRLGQGRPVRSRRRRCGRPTDGTGRPQERCGWPEQGVGRALGSRKAVGMAATVSMDLL